jgi:hypothetical protein
MPGLLNGLLPYIYSQSDRLKRNVNGLLSDPIGSMSQTAGLLQDKNREMNQLNSLAFSNPQQPFQVTNQNALSEMAGNVMNGLLGFAPAGMTRAVGAAKLGEMSPTNSSAPAPTDQQLKSWDLGQKHRKMLGEDGTRSADFYESLPSHELDFVSKIEDSDPVSRAFYESAIRNADQPKFTAGYRYGNAPENGTSWNHVDQRPELGVSMANVKGYDYQWYPMQQVGKPVKYQGLALDYDKFFGSDGEPLMVGLRPAAP